MTKTLPPGRVLALLVALALATALSACSNSSKDEERDHSTASATTFPITVDTGYGKITVPKKPQRIVVLDWALLDALHWLGETPIVVAGDATEFARSTPQWAGLYDGKWDDTLQGSDYLASAEAIARWEPDLILGTPWGVPETTYDQLSAIAPTYVGTEDWVTPWDKHLEAIALLTGHDPTILDKVESELATEFATWTTQLAGLQDKTFQLAVLAEDRLLWLTEYANEPLQSLGLQLGEGQPTGVGEDRVEGKNATKLSLENIDKLDADVVFIAVQDGSSSEDAKDALAKDPRTAELPATRNGTLIYLTDAQWSALGNGDPSSLRWAMPQLVEQLEESTLNRSGG